MPSFWVDGFTDGAKDFELAHVVLGGELFAELHEGPDGGGGGVELGHLVLFDDLENALAGGVERGALEEN